MYQCEVKLETLIGITEMGRDTQDSPRPPPTRIPKVISYHDSSNNRHMYDTI